MKRLFLFLALGIFLATGVSAAPTTKLGLEWDANSEPNLAGYKVYYNTTKAGPPYDGVGQTEGDSPIDVGNITEFWFNSMNISSEKFWFVVTAYSTEGFESSYSNEVTSEGLVPAPPTGCRTVKPSK